MSTRPDAPYWLSQKRHVRRVVCQPVTEPQFFGWLITWGGMSERTYALVEVEDGRVRQCDATYVQFIDAPESL